MDYALMWSIERPSGIKSDTRDEGRTNLKRGEHDWG